MVVFFQCYLVPDKPCRSSDLRHIKKVLLLLLFEFISSLLMISSYVSFFSIILKHLKCFLYFIFHLICITCLHLYLLIYLILSICVLSVLWIYLSICQTSVRLLCFGDETNKTSKVLLSWVLPPEGEVQRWKSKFEFFLYVLKCAISSHHQSCLFVSEHKMKLVIIIL